MNIHAFQLNGLGEAPFTFQGVDEQPDGCDHCGTAIRFRFWLKSADGQTFKVGSDCIEKTGDAGLIDIARERVNQRRREAAQAKRDAAWLVECNAQRARNPGGLTDWELAEAEQEAEKARKAPIIETLLPLADQLQDDRGNFRDSVARSLREGFVPSPNGQCIVAEILGKLAGRKGGKAFTTEKERVLAILAAADTALKSKETDR